MGNFSDRVHAWSTRRIKRIYGDYELHQFPFYRCRGCGKVITWRAIRKSLSGGVCNCGTTKMSPTNLTFLEELRILFFHWSMP